MPLIDDGHLVGFWPMNEGSGAPLFRNYSSSYGQRPSGVSFDFQVHITDSPLFDIEKMSYWPGREIVASAASGTNYVGYKAQGTTTLINDNDGPTSKVLIVGDGGYPQRSALVVPSLAQSGFTVGMWVNPQSDGAIGVLNTDTAAHNEYEGLSQFHNLLGQYGGDDGFLMGVSGRLANDARASDPADYQLRAFAHVNTTNTDLQHLNTPIERDRFTHLTFSYRYVDGTSNEIALYRDGRLAASGATNVELTAANSDFAEKVLTLGGTLVRTTNNTSDFYEHASGWGHLVSGVYAFNRVLHEGEVLQLHDEGGFDIPLNLLPEMNEVVLTDPKMIAYYPVRSRGYIDVSPNHHNLFSDQDLSTRENTNGNLEHYFVGGGPFDRSMIYNAAGSTTHAIGLAAGSGLINGLLDNRSFTIGCWYSQDNSTSYGQNSVFSFGSIGTAITTDRQTGGFYVRGSATTDHHIEAVVYNGGQFDDRVTLRSQSRDVFEQIHTHVALAYDDQTFGLALYVNGELAESGVLPTSMHDQNERLAFSGYPLLFGNGVVGEVIDVYDGNGGNSCGWGDMFVMGRPMLPQEVRSLAASGVTTDDLDLTPHDQRLIGYWRCTDATGNNAFVKDSALSYAGAGLPAHLTRAISDSLWDEIEDSDDGGQHYSIDPFTLNVRSDLGITSGVFSVMGGSKGVHFFTAGNDERHTSSSSFSTRFKLTQSDRDMSTPSRVHEQIWSFDVTPSGDIPKVLLGDGDSQYNSTLATYGESTSDRSFIYLTSELAEQGSGIQVVMAARDGAVFEPLASGNVSYGDTSKILLHIKPLQPNTVISTGTDQPLLVHLYIDGVKSYSRQVPAFDSLLWSNGTPNSTADDWVLQFGGRSLSDSFQTVQVAVRDGLGAICLKNIFLMTGQFTGAEVESLAANGITDATNVSGYNEENLGTTVINADPDLLGYWRFTGQINAGNQSGVTDLSSKSNHLDPISQVHAENFGFAAQTNTALNLRYLPGPMSSGLLAVQASGITYENSTISDVNTLPPFAVSGAAFNNPNDGFSVGFWMARRTAVGTSDGRYIVGYGPIPVVESSASFVDASWAVMIDEDESVKLCLSDGGSMPWGDNVSSPHIRTCGAFGDFAHQKENIIETFRRGNVTPGALDGWCHYGWSFNKEEQAVKCYLNGVPIDRRPMPASGFHVPLSEDAKMISVFVPQEDNVWQFDATRAGFGEVLTDLFYFSRALTDEEMFFVAASGMAPAETTTGSGLIGGYVHGLGEGSGLLGGYLQGLNTGSGLFGGFIVGATDGSGLVGGYIQGSAIASGVLGGLMLGVELGSGLLGGYMQGINLGSGLLGSFLIGALTGEQRFDGGFNVTALAAEDFDALVEIERTAASDFDAKVVLFEEELAPQISIIIPEAKVEGLTPNLCQYFVGSGTPQQGKSIDFAKWSFGDMSAPVKLLPPGSGAGSDLYPQQHCFLGSGYFTTRFTLTDSQGLTSSAIRVVDAASGVSPVLITLSGVPVGGAAPLQVQFSQITEALPTNVIIAQSLLDFGDGQTTTTLNPIHVYNEPGTYIPIWTVRDSRGVIWSDTIEPGIDVL